MILITKKNLASGPSRYFTFTYPTPPLPLPAFSSRGKSLSIVQKRDDSKSLPPEAIRYLFLKKEMVGNLPTPPLPCSLLRRCILQLLLSPESETTRPSFRDNTHPPVSVSETPVPPLNTPAPLHTQLQRHLSQVLRQTPMVSETSHPCFCDKPHRFL